VTEPQRYHRAPCSRCGAVTEVEAATRCRPTLGCDDEYWCPGSDVEADAEGYLRDLTPDWVAWFDQSLRQGP
jgi:hypothetical protein